MPGVDLRLTVPAFLRAGNVTQEPDARCIRTHDNKDVASYRKFMKNVPRGQDIFSYSRDVSCVVSLHNVEQFNSAKGWMYQTSWSDIPCDGESRVAFLPVPPTDRYDEHEEASSAFHPYVLLRTRIAQTRALAFDLVAWQPLLIDCAQYPLQVAWIAHLPLAKKLYTLYRVNMRNAVPMVVSPGENNSSKRRRADDDSDGDEQNRYDICVRQNERPTLLSRVTDYITKMITDEEVITAIESFVVGCKIEDEQGRVLLPHHPFQTPGKEDPPHTRPRVQNVQELIIASIGYGRHATPDVFNWRL